jgi:hypothetical protein
MDIAEEMKEVAENLIYVLNNPEDDIISDIKESAQDIVWVSKKLKSSDAGLFLG